ncbi:ABC transporter ATP-binding protein [Kribbella speibonae]|uniref:ABC transporter ATP-binding protein n=1 Tax=Kribbella speibonae TaxID=1572660 RepID=A0A4R0J8W8_9ACTN|nr:ABC transporter ATP-binding protein [Kribbella speibonae]TCC18126.1 ABC transporter ATP-binding protein [Kribbella speibonae]TCC42140.1 ABC transporter ATP-binding protein [Kribbella speibonae]
MTESVTSAPPADTRAGKPFLEVKDLQVHFPTDDGLVKAVNGLNFTLERGKTLGIVGESGSGKSVSSLAIMGLHKGSKAKVNGEIWLDGAELVGMSVPEMRALRGQQVAMIFQDPLSAMHPFYRVGDQLTEAFLVHNNAPKAVAKKRAVELLDRVGIPSPDKRFFDYPHQFSGGMRQRAMIAMALMCDPALLIADEPTTALDVTVQAQILDLMKDLQKEFNSAIILITHDLGVVAKMTENVVVMYGGRVVESGNVRDIFYRPEMPYTWGLLGSIPRVNRSGDGRLKSIRGTPPSLINLPKGCPFQPRCDYQEHVEGANCATELPELLQIGQEQHRVRCHINSEQRKQLFTEQIKPSL